MRYYYEFSIRRYTWIFILFVILDISIADSYNSTLFNDIYTPLNAHRWKTCSLPEINWRHLSIEQKSRSSEELHHITKVKGDEFDILIMTLEARLSKYQEENKNIYDLNEKLKNKLSNFRNLYLQPEIQSILGPGLMELNKTRYLLNYACSLLNSEIENSFINDANSNKSIVEILQTPINDLILDLGTTSYIPTKIAKGYRLLAAYRERSNVISDILSEIDENITNLNVLVSVWDMIISEIDLLIQNHFNPILDDEKYNCQINKDKSERNRRCPTSSYDMQSEIINLNKKIKKSLIDIYEDGKGILIKVLSFEKIDLDSLCIKEYEILWKTEFLPSINRIMTTSFPKYLEEFETIVTIDKSDPIKEALSLKTTIESYNKILNETSNRIVENWSILKYITSTNKISDLKVININEDYDTLYDSISATIKDIIVNMTYIDQNLDKHIDNFKEDDNGFNINLSIQTMVCLKKIYDDYGTNYPLKFDTHINNNQCIDLFTKYLPKSNHDNDPVSTRQYELEKLISFLHPSSLKSFNNEDNMKEQISPIILLLEELQREITEVELDENFKQRQLKRRKYLMDISNNFDISRELFDQNLRDVRYYLEKNVQLSFKKVEEYANQVESIINEYIVKITETYDHISNAFNDTYKDIIILLNEMEINNQNMPIPFSYVPILEKLQYQIDDIITRINIIEDRTSRINLISLVQDLKTNFTNLKNSELEFQLLCSNVSSLLYDQSTYPLQIILAQTDIYSNNCQNLELGHQNLNSKNSEVQSINSNNEFQYNKLDIQLLRAKYKDILKNIGIMISKYQLGKKMYTELQLFEGSLVNNIKSIEKIIDENSKFEDIPQDMKLKIQKYRKLSTKILTSLINLQTRQYISDNEILKNIVFILDNVISKYTQQVKQFKVENQLNKSHSFKKLIKRVFKFEKYIKAKRYYKKMKRLSELILDERNRKVKYINYNEEQLDIMNKKVQQIINDLLCNDSQLLLNHPDSTKNILTIDSNHVNNTVSSIFTKLYDIIYRSTEIEYIKSPRHILQLLKSLEDISIQYTQLFKKIELYRNQSIRLYTEQQQTLNDIKYLIKNIIVATNIVKIYKKLPSKFLKYISNKSPDYLEFINQVNIRGWNINQAAKRLPESNLLYASRKYIQNIKEYEQFQEIIQAEIDKLNIPIIELTNRDKIILIIVPEQILRNLEYNLETQQIALINNEMNRTLQPNYTSIHELLKDLIQKRSKYITQMTRQELIVKEGNCMEEK
ncbi:uncharacterized protein CMU_015950 [Cryptosporidium muris RN66]|uniref:Uncharacterized protein n=1 Tax=Cryptosporidium muris (strain RN66) TaxID=441375 RepID=B6ACJ3_CRYMR|nr:uncharacterized protein CMU_015950 [Cryptosporidium muris RN66]EEA05847.1 hypothetical protein CMU_015950 [Cryptosporidium muris RN66]|eukprot:XP_002140196.1 hypothetical protein [Cryptosporidium muris RN66]